MIDRYVHAIWCDDIRQEVGNKPSFMGVYTGGILLPTLPMVLPRLAVHIWVNTPSDRPFQKLAIRVVRDDGFALLEMQQDPSSEAVNFVPSQEIPDATRHMVMAGFALTGVEVPAGCKYFAVTVETESETLEGPKLRVIVSPQEFPEVMGDTVQQPSPSDVNQASTS